MIGYCPASGALQKIIHHPHTSTMLLLAAILKTTGALLLLYKLVIYPKLSDFRDR